MIPKSYSVENISKQLSHYLDRADDTIVLGWSLGGLIAIELAKQYPDKVSQLILVASSPKFVQASNWPYAVEKKVFINFAQQLKQDIKKTIKHFVAIAAMGGKTSKEDIKTILKLIDKRGYAEYEVLNKGLTILLESDQRSTLLSLTTPTMMIVGNRDSLINIKALNYLLEYSNNLSLAVISGAGHAPFISHLEQFIKILKPSLEKTHFEKPHIEK